jgi:hypothetical protein
MVAGERGIGLLSRYVYHITGLAVVALVVLYLDTPIKHGLRASMAPNQNYSQESRTCFMRELEIDTGFIGDDIVALCADVDYEYAFYAEKGNGQYLVRMSSTHGIISTGKYDLSTPPRQLILIAMANHMNVVDAMIAEQKSERAGIAKSLH